MLSGQKEMSLLQGAGSWGNSRLWWVPGSWPDGPSQRLDLRKYTKGRDAGIGPPHSDTPVPYPRRFPEKMQLVTWENFRIVQKTPTMQIKVHLLFCSTLITQTPILKILSSFGSSSAPGSILATACCHQFPWQVGGHLPPGQQPPRLP